MAKKKDFGSKTRRQSGSGLTSIIRKTTEDLSPDLKEKSIPVESAPLPKAKSTSVPKPLTPVVKAIDEGPSSEKGCKPGDTRKTFILRKDLVEKMMDIAYWEPGKMKDHVNAAFSAYVEEHWKQGRPDGS